MCHVVVVVLPFLDRFAVLVCDCTKEEKNAGI